MAAHVAPQLARRRLRGSLPLRTPFAKMSSSARLASKYAVSLSSQTSSAASLTAEISSPSVVSNILPLLRLIVSSSASAFVPKRCRRHELGQQCLCRNDEQEISMGQN
jgi:hypothetical protein